MVLTEAQKFEFMTLAQATERAAREAVERVAPHYVVEVYTDFVPLHAESRTSLPIPTHAVNFAAYNRSDLSRVLHLDHSSTGLRLSILRVAHADGTLEAVRDPGDYAGRMAAFVNQE